MKLIHVMPHLPSESEVWLDRMIGILAENTVAIAVEGSEVEMVDSIPVLSLYPRQPFWWRVLYHSGFSVAPPIGVRQGMCQNLMRTIEQWQPDTLLFHYLNYAVEFEELLSRFDGKVFYHLHGYDATWDFREYETPGTRKFPDDYEDRVCNLAKRGTIIANSRFMAKELRSIGVPEDRIVVKYFGVNSAPELSSERKNQILFVGRFVEAKGPGLVLDVFERACDLGFDGTLLMIGDGMLWEECNLRRLRSKYRDRIQMPGSRNAKACLVAYQESSLFLTHNILGPRTRQCEAFGVTFLEAMANGLPVVSTLSGGIPEIVVQNKTGLLSEPYDFDTQVQNVLSLSTDVVRRQKLGMAGRQRALEVFSVEQEKQRFQRILSS